MPNRERQAAVAGPGFLGGLVCASYTEPCCLKPNLIVMKNVVPAQKKSRLEYLFDEFSPKIPHEGPCATTFDELFALDPSSSKRHLQWILRLATQGLLKKEDHYKVKHALEELRRCAYMLKRDGLSRNLYDYESLPALSRVLMPYDKELNPAQLGEQERRAIDAETHFIFRSDELQVVCPLTQAASAFWGRGTQWCTAATESENDFKSYVEDGSKLFVFIYKGQKYQLHTGGDFLDASDDQFSADICNEIYKSLPVSVLQENPGLYSAIVSFPSLLEFLDQTPEFCEVAVAKLGVGAFEVLDEVDSSLFRRVFDMDSRAVAYAKEYGFELTDEQWLAAIADSPYRFFGYDNPSQEFILKALSVNGQVLQFFSDHTKEMSDVALRAPGSGIAYSNYATEDDWEQCLLRSSSCFEDLKNQTERLCLAALGAGAPQTEFGKSSLIRTFHLIQDRTPRIVERFLELVPSAVREVPESMLSPAALDLVVKGAPQALVRSKNFVGSERKSLLPLLSQAQTLDFLREYPQGIVDIPDPSQEMLVIAIEADPSLIAKLSDPSAQLKRLALEKDPELIGKIHSPTEEDCLFAVSRDPYSIRRLAIQPQSAQLKALENPDFSAEFLTNPSPEVVLACVMARPANILLTAQPSTDLMMAVAHSGESELLFEHFKELPDEVIHAAVANKPSNLLLIKDPAAGLLEAAITRDPMSVGFIKNPGADLCRLAYRLNPGSFEKMRQPPQDLCVQAAVDSPDAMRFLANPTVELVGQILERRPSRLADMLSPAHKIRFAPLVAMLAPGDAPVKERLRAGDDKRSQKTHKQPGLGR